MALIMFRRPASLLILCSVLASALSCDWLIHYSDLRNSSLVLVEAMGGAFTEQKSSVPFPFKLYNRRGSRKAVSPGRPQLQFIRDSLQQIYDLYRYNDVSSAGWDSVKTMNFLESINRQIEELNECVKSTHKKRANRPLEDYYKKLKHQTLHHPDGSRAGWEILRKETKQHLIRLDLLGNLLLAATRGQQDSTYHL